MQYEEARWGAVCLILMTETFVFCCTKRPEKNHVIGGAFSLFFFVMCHDIDLQLSKRKKKKKTKWAYKPMIVSHTP